jgi:hypothetical protein
MQLELYVLDGQNEGFLHAQTIADRLRKQFPSTLVDWDKGDARVQRRLDDLIANNCPDLILQSQQTCFGHMAYIEICEPHWSGGRASSYVLSMEPLQGDTLAVEIQADCSEKEEEIAMEIMCCLGMVRVGNGD